MVITGAGGGIMAAAHEGAGSEHSLGFNIILPFEQHANPTVNGTDKLLPFHFFFIRKLFFVKEADGLVLCPGGFGTLDEALEVLTLIQTGKSHWCRWCCWTHRAAASGVTAWTSSAASWKKTATSCPAT